MTRSNPQKARHRVGVRLMWLGDALMAMCDPEISWNVVLYCFEHVAGVTPEWKQQCKS